MKILDFGSCNIDYVYDVEHLVLPGETLMASNLSKFPGGKGLNQSIAIAKAGAHVYLAGCIGEDDTILRPILKQADVDISNLLPVKEPTGHAIIQVDKNGENSIVIYRGANGAVSNNNVDNGGNTNNNQTNVSNDFISMLKVSKTGDYLKGYSLGTTVSEIKNKVGSSASVVIKDSNGNVKKDGDAIGTGYVIEISNSAGSKAYTYVMYGDVSGDGEINSADLLKIRQYLLGQINLCSLV